MRDHLRGHTALGRGTALSWLANPKWLWFSPSVASSLPTPGLAPPWLFPRLCPILQRGLSHLCALSAFTEKGAGPGRERSWNSLLGPDQSLFCFVLSPGNSYTLFGIVWVCFHFHIVNPALICHLISVPSPHPATQLCDPS